MIAAAVFLPVLCALLFLIDYNLKRCKIMTNNGGAETLNDALCDIARTTGGGVDFETIPGEGGDVECPYCGEVTLPRGGGECMACGHYCGVAP